MRYTASSINNCNTIVPIPFALMNKDSEAVIYVEGFQEPL